MANNPKFYWKLGKFPDFEKDFRKLDPYPQWITGKIIENMKTVKNPLRAYPLHKKCSDCDDDVYLFGMLDDGLGHKGLELQINLDKKKKILTPITVRKVKR